MKIQMAISVSKEFKVVLPIKAPIHYHKYSKDEPLFNSQAINNLLKSNEIFPKFSQNFKILVVLYLPFFSFFLPFSFPFFSSFLFFPFFLEGNFLL